MSVEVHRTWPLAASVWPTVAICSFYVLVAKVIGPKLMTNRNAVQLTNLKLVYNVLMVIVNLILFLSFGFNGWFNKYDLTCQPVDWSDSGLALSRTTYVYFLTRFVEFVDTLFFLLSKKFDHISPLHLIHHSTVPICTWIGFTMSPNGHGTMSTFLNSGVHVLMYTYYALAALGPNVRKHLWWKRYLTQVQLIQFAVIFGHGVQVLFRPSCDFPRVAIYALLGTMVYLFGLFAHFYVHSYLMKKNSSLSKVSKLTVGDGDGLSVDPITCGGTIVRRHQRGA